jgi:hypothetical protein
MRCVTLKMGGQLLVYLIGDIAVDDRIRARERRRVPGSKAREVRHISSSAIS